jgi:hypothetical protein
VTDAPMMAAGHGFSVSSVNYGVRVEERGVPAAGIVRRRLVTITRMGEVRQDVGDLAGSPPHWRKKACPAPGYTAARRRLDMMQIFLHHTTGRSQARAAPQGNGLPSSDGCLPWSRFGEPEPPNRIA